MTQGFQHQQPLTNFGFNRTAAQPQQVGVRIKPNDKQKPSEPDPERPQERRAF